MVLKQTPRYEYTVPLPSRLDRVLLALAISEGVRACCSYAAPIERKDAGMFGLTFVPGFTRTVTSGCEVASVLESIAVTHSLPRAYGDQLPRASPYLHTHSLHSLLPLTLSCEHSLTLQLPTPATLATTPGTVRSISLPCTSHMLADFALVGSRLFEPWFAPSSLLGAKSLDATA